MRKFAYTTLPVAALALAAGCASSGSSSTTNFTADLSSVGVRFVIPPAPETTASNLASSGAAYADLAGYTGFVPVSEINDGESSHVALWGGGFNGQDVTFASTALEPGMYTFAYLNPDSDSAVQGWLDVNPGGTQILDFLTRWSANIPQMREAMAYEIELSGGTTSTNPFYLDGFAKQLGAFERLERQLNSAIAREQQAQAESTEQYNEFLRNAEVLLLPSPTGFFHPTTQPAVSEAELAGVRGGTPISKTVLLADADTMLWKLNRINEVYSELTRCKIVLTEEADRLQRRKRFYTLTDHIYNYDKLFVHNELRMQQTYAAIDQINENIRELRERRMAMAFISELVAPDGSFKTLDKEESDLGREKVVLQARMNQINQLFNDAPENSDKRVILERHRQEVTHGLDTIAEQVATVAQARIALEAMNKSTDVIHRQGDWRLMTASLVDADIPFNVRRAIEEESLMTFRLEPSKTVFVPSTTRFTSMPPMFSPDVTTFTFYNPNGNVQLVSQRSHGGFATTTTTSNFPQSSKSVWNTRRNQSHYIGCPTCHDSNCTNCPLNGHVNAWHAFWHGFCTNCPFNGVVKTTGTIGSTANANGSTAKTTVQPVSAGPSGAGNNNSNNNSSKANNSSKKNNGNNNADCGVPFPIKLLVPPCWFENSNN